MCVCVWREKVDCYKIGNYTVCRRVRASFSPEILCTCVCVCVCVRETDRQTDRDRERQRHRESQRDRDRERDRETQREREGEKHFHLGPALTLQSRLLAVERGRRSIFTQGPL